MATVPVSHICQNCQDKNFSITDATGAYNASTNPTGWGAPNPDISDVQSAYVKVTLPDGTFYTADVSATLPNLTEVPFIFLPTMMGLTATDQIPDGVYLIEVIYSGINSTGGVPFTIQSSQQELFKCNAQCCVNKKMAGAGGGCACKHANEGIDLAVLLESAVGAAKCGKFEKAQVEIDKVNEICGLDCGCNG